MDDINNAEDAYDVYKTYMYECFVYRRVAFTATVGSTTSSNKKHDATWRRQHDTLGEHGHVAREQERAYKGSWQHIREVLVQQENTSSIRLRTQICNREGAITNDNT